MRLSEDIVLRYGAAALRRDTYGWQTTRYPTRRAGLTCLAPVHLKCAAQANGALEASWIRRSRLGGDDFDAAEIVLGETNQAYQVSVQADGEVVFRRQTNRPSWVYSLGWQRHHQTIHRATQWSLHVAQISSVQGAGYESSLDISHLHNSYEKELL